MKVSSVNNKITSTQLVLAGIAMSTLFTALTNLMIYYKRTGDDKVKTAMYWMMGSLSGANWDTVLYVFIVSVICIAVIGFFAGGLDVLMLGRYAHKKRLEDSSKEDRTIAEKCIEEVGMGATKRAAF